MVEQIADRAIVLEQGWIAEQSETMAVLGNPHHLYTQRLLVTAHRSS